MALVVFMRGVNVGGNKVFRPALLARELAALDVVNIGAAGTYVVRKPIAQAKLRAALLKRLPFDAVVIICRGREVIDLVRQQPFPDVPGLLVRRLVAVMARRPRTLPRLPVHEPPGDRWESRVFGVSGRFALSLWRRLRERGFLEPNGVIEKHFGVRATTRNWNTINKIRDILQQ